MVVGSSWLRNGYTIETKAHIDETKLIKKHRNREEKEEKKEKHKKARENEDCHRPKSQRLGQAAEKGFLLELFLRERKSLCRCCRLMLSVQFILTLHKCIAN